MSRKTEPKREPKNEVFVGAAGNKLVADIFGESGRPVLLLHGGGQTRHAWRKTAMHLAETGWLACAIDQRGHGDSEWIADAAYDWTTFAADARIVADELARRCGGTRPVAIGASLGGYASMLAIAETEAHAKKPAFSAVVLVDITPRVDRAGVKKIQAFMKAHAAEGFDSIEEAAEAVARYLPHRPRPRSNEGLKKNLRQSSDGRWRWHWDPRFLEGRRSMDADHTEIETAMTEAAKRIRIPTLLVRGGSSELVQEVHVKEFMKLVPQAEYADVTGARHMVAGDRNDQFAAAILDFLGKLGKETPAEQVVH
jgi:pimeloyl-ACP methyl ester carboxylesterase